MKFRQADKDVIAGIILLAISLALYSHILQIRWGHQQFLYSAMMLPMVSNVMFSFLSAVLIVKGVLKGGRPRREWIDVIKNGVLSKKFRTVTTAMVSIGVLIFVAMPLIGFWASGAIFMLGALLFYVRAFNPIVSILVTAATLGSLYGLFVMLLGFRIS